MDLTAVRKQQKKKKKTKGDEFQCVDFRRGALAAYTGSCFIKGFTQTMFGSHEIRLR